MRIRPVSTIVLLVLFASVLKLSPSVLAADPRTDGGSRPNYSFAPGGTYLGNKNLNQESTSPDPLAYVPVIALITPVSFLLYFARREIKV
ncbi:MAG: hypothetical protein NWE78_03190 [Candidatus Bathyarchaeota archaeon]|nr:hypothetical protein [Candidatus Bathyarchaeota archaeon]